jgi:hypothetical protein
MPEHGVALGVVFAPARGGAIEIAPSLPPGNPEQFWRDAARPVN